jgi:hypothetical protein
MAFCKHSRYSEVLLAGARGFYLSLLERVFHVKILCLRAVISFSFFVIAYRFYNTHKIQLHQNKSAITHKNRVKTNVTLSMNKHRYPKCETVTTPKKIQWHKKFHLQ